ncbi:DUF2681 domain-containing protein [Haemophilus parahaemolyticus]|uniref:DUF2681 domain-containing protein n=1 Tax=Haemophilus parahaemolyticus TaxID=735 RepID=UPI0028E9ACE5|nr:DUF2681 domain-containing protein [Haemophilus parahaemolyticus]
MSVLSLFGAGALVVLGLAGFATYKIRKTQQEIDRLFKAHEELEEKNRRQAVEIRQKNAEVRNAKTYRQNQESAHRISASGVDEQLQQHGWFRDGGSDGMQCVRADLSQSCRHSENETSDSGSQSDL